MNTEEKTRYFKELTRNLQHDSFTVGQEENGLLAVELDGQRLCLAMDTGRVRYWKEDVLGDSRSAALDRVTDIVRTTAEYMSQIVAAPQLGVARKGITGSWLISTTSSWQGIPLSMEFNSLPGSVCRKGPPCIKETTMAPEQAWTATPPPNGTSLPGQLQRLLVQRTNAEGS